MDGLTAFTRIRDRSLLAHLSEIDAFALSGAMEVVEVPAGSAVPRPERPEAAFFVVEGEVALYASTTETDPVGRAGRGKLVEPDVFLGGGARWQHHWFCEQPAILLRLPAAELMQAIEGTEGLLTYLRRVRDDHGLRRLDNDLRLFGAPAAAAVRLIGGVEKVTWARLSEAYRRHPGFAVLAEGELGVQVEVAGKKVDVGPFGRGDFVFLDDRLAAVKARPDVECWYVTVAAWRRELRQHDVEDFCAIADPVSVKRAALLAAPEPEEAPQSRLQLDATDDDDGLSVADFKVEPAELSRLHRRRRPVVRQHDEMDCGAACISRRSPSFHGRKRIGIPHLPLPRPRHARGRVARCAEAGRGGGHGDGGPSAMMSGLNGLRERPRAA
jgi:CRP-like cAMP-binding protein